MPRGPDVKPRQRAAVAYTPLPGFTERAPGVWAPSVHRPSPHEYPSPILHTPEDVAEEYVRCSRSLPHFVFSSCWSLHTDDPEGDPVYRKFPVYPHLVEFFREVQRPSNIHIEKSRQMLMSWAWMAVFLWDILFHTSWGNLAVSQTEKKVDDGAWNSTTDSLFGKLRVLHASLPPHLQHPIEMTYLQVRCPTTNSYIKGVSGATGGGRGSTYKRALLDEAAHIPRGETLFRAVHEAAKNGLALNSTPLGKGNVFARIRFQPRTSFRRLSFHWSQHPEKAKGLYCTCGWVNDDPTGRTSVAQFMVHECIPSDTANAKLRAMRSPWYDHATADYTQEQIASEFDLSYERSMRGRVFAPFDERLHVRDHHALPVPGGGTLGAKRDSESPAQYRERYLRAVLDPRLVTVCSWDFGVNDPTFLCLGQIVDEQSMTIRWVDEFSGHDQGWAYYHKFVMGLWQPLVREITRQDILHYGDPAGKGRESDLMSWISNLRAFEDPREAIVVVHTPHRGKKLEWLDFIAERIRRNHFEIMLWCTTMIDALGQYHFPLDNEGNPVPGKFEPVHDEWSHPMDSMRYTYQFRYHGRLMDTSQRGPSVSEIFEIGEHDRNETAPGIF